MIIDNSSLLILSQSNFSNHPFLPSHRCFSVNWALQQHLPARSRALALRFPSSTYIGRGVGLVREELPGRYIGYQAVSGGGVTTTDGADVAMSLKEVYLDHCAEVHEDPTWLEQYVHRYLHTCIPVNSDSNNDGNINDGKGDGHGKETGQKHGRDDGNKHDNHHQPPLPQQDRETLHHRAYKEACSLVPSTLLRDFFLTHNATAYTTWTARREFASQLGLLAALQCLLGARGLGPDQLVVHPLTGALVAAGLTPHLPPTPITGTGTSNKEDKDLGDQQGDNLGVVENHTPPFRLTRNMVGALSGALLLGVTTVNIGVSMDAYMAHRDVVEVYLSMLLLESMKARETIEKREKQGQGQRQPSSLESMHDVEQVND